MQIGILQTGEAPDGIRSELGDYPDLFETLLAGRGLTFRRYAVLHDRFPASVEECEGWLITGSKFGVYDDLPWIHRLESFIRDAHAARVPVVGICFGHQMIAQAMGGKVEKYAGGWSVGPTDYDFQGETLTVNAWHQDQVTVKPEGARVIASTPFCRYAGLLYDGGMYSIQPHPEFDNTYVREFIRLRGRGTVPDDRLDAAEARLGDPPDSATIAERIARFFKEHRRSSEEIPA